MKHRLNTDKDTKIIPLSFLSVFHLYYYPSFSSLFEKNFHAASFAVLAWRAVSNALITSAPSGLIW
jgi:hypothetical protein